MTMRPDPTFHASPKLAMEAPPESFAYTLLLSPDFSKPDALAVIDVKPGSPTFSQVVHTVVMPNKGDEFHHFGWNACSSALSPLAGHAFLERRYLIIPGMRSSRIYIVDTKPDPTQAKIHKIIEPEEIFKKTGYSRPHTVHCGPEGIYVSTLGGGGKDGTDGPPGVFIMDCETFDVLGRWEIDRGPRPCIMTSGGICHATTWCRASGRCLRSLRMGSCRRIFSRTSTAIGFTSGISGLDEMSRRSISAPIIKWRWKCARRTIRFASTASWASWWTPPTSKARSGPGGARVASFTSRRRRRSQPEPAQKDQLPPLLQGFGAVPPLVTDIDLSMDDKFLYVACWGTGEMRQYDVTDPRKPKLAGSVHVGGIVRRTPHPNGKAYAGGPQMVEISRDGKRVYWTNSLYSTWDDQFYPSGIPGAEVMANANPGGGLELAKDYWVSFPDGYRAHQIRLDGGDCSTDSFCYPSV